jgi:hypothetical protein
VRERRDEADSPLASAVWRAAGISVEESKFRERSVEVSGK